MIAVTGATGGLGVEICLQLAQRGLQPVLLCRNEQKAQALMRRITEQFPDCTPLWVPLDLQSDASVQQAAAQLLRLPLTGLIHNAGVYGGDAEGMMRVNCDAPLALTGALLPLLEKGGVQVVLVTSLATRMAREHSRLAMRVYGHTKRRALQAMRALCARHGIPLSLAHPGITPTGITGHYPRALRALIHYPMKWIFSPPRKAARCIVEALLHPVSDGIVAPAILGIWGKPRARR